MKVLVGKFLEKESSSGIILIFITIIALIFSNTFLSDFYNTFLHTTIEFRIGSILEISKPLILWVNDGLMAIFFLMIGLEIKRELILGHLSKISKVTLPLIGAFGGMVVPAFIFFPLATPSFNITLPVIILPEVATIPLAELIRSIFALKLGFPFPFSSGYFK